MSLHPNPARALLLVLASLLVSSAVPRSQGTAFSLVRRDGSVVLGQPSALAVKDGGARLAFATPSGVVDLAFGDIVAIHAAGPDAAGSAAVLAVLVGGERISCDLEGGDREGEHFVVRSASLGPVSIAVDRLEVLLFLARATEADLPRLRVPANAPFDESCSVRARRGFDTTFGEIHRFERDGLAFAVGGGEAVATRRYDQLAAIALRGGAPREKPGTCLLSTRAGDAIEVDWLALHDDALRIRLEGGSEIDLPLHEVAAITPHDPATRFVSDLDPVSVDERSYFAENAEPLYAFRRDGAVAGGPLRAAGRVYAKGLGVHSQSHLVFVVPAGAAALVGLVAIDDSVRDLPVRGDVAVHVSVDGKELFGLDSLTTALGVKSLGRIAVQPGQRVELRVDFGAGLDLGDRVDWLDLAFVR